MIPEIISGGSHSDERGMLRFNNSFDATMIKRMYVIENKDANWFGGGKVTGLSSDGFVRCKAVLK